MRILQHPRGTTANNDGFVGEAGQITVDVERWEIRLHDGETPGGHRILNLQQLLLLFMSKDSEFGDVGFDEGDRGILTRIGDRQWALREITAGTGITITNGLGTDGNFIISTSAGLGGMAGSIPSALTTGTAGAFLADLPTGWPTSDGAIALLKFHLAPTDGATLSVDGAAPLPLITADGSNNINEVLGINDYGLVIRYGDQFILVGLQTPTGLGLTDIAGLTATNVQDAIAELVARLAAIEGVDTASGAKVNGFYKFANLAGSTESGAVPIADGEVVYIQCRGGRDAGDDYKLSINGVRIWDGAVGASLFWDLMISRIGTAIYYTPVQRQISHITGDRPGIRDDDIQIHTGEWGNGAVDFGSVLNTGQQFSPANYYSRQVLIPVGTVLPAATTVAVSMGDPDGRITWSAPGVLIA